MSSSSALEDSDHQQRLKQLGLIPRVWQTRSRWPLFKQLETAYTPINVIGSGVTGNALLARDKKTVGEPLVILKLYAPSEATSESEEHMEQAMEAEIDALIAIYRASGAEGHRNVVSYLGRFRWAPETDKDVPDVLKEYHYKPNIEYIGLVLEYINGVDLIEFTEQWWERPEQSNTMPPPSLVRQLLRGALSGLTYLHALGFAHRDIKPGNLRVQTEDMETVILDLGFACHVLYDAERDDSLACKQRPYAGSPMYISPEFAAAVASNRMLSTAQAMASDVWSLALSFLVLIAGAMPYPRAKTIDDVLRTARGYRQPPDVVYVLDTELNELLKRMLVRDWKHRITATAALMTLDHMSEPMPSETQQQQQRSAPLHELVPQRRDSTLSQVETTGLKRTQSMR